MAGNSRRCITFGAPRVGNFAFVDAFKWLVGLSYRCVYERDAVVDKPRSAFLTSFHGESTLTMIDDRCACALHCKLDQFS